MAPITGIGESGWVVGVYCSDCGEDAEVLVEDLDDVDAEVCPCGYGFVIVRVAAHVKELVPASAGAD